MCVECEGHIYCACDNPLCASLYPPACVIHSWKTPPTCCPTTWSCCDTMDRHMHGETVLSAHNLAASTRHWSEQSHAQQPPTWPRASWPCTWRIAQDHSNTLTTQHDGIVHTIHVPAFLTPIQPPLHTHTPTHTPLLVKAPPHLSDCYIETVPRQQLVYPLLHTISKCPCALACDEQCVAGGDVICLVVVEEAALHLRTKQLHQGQRLCGIDRVVQHVGVRFTGVNVQLLILTFPNLVDFSLTVQPLLDSFFVGLSKSIGG